MNVQSRLTIRRLGQLFERSVPGNPTQIAPKHFIRSPEQIGGAWRLFRQISTHPDDLRALAGKKKCDLAIHYSRSIRHL
jgi:hypothetical protein